MKKWLQKKIDNVILRHIIAMLKHKAGFDEKDLDKISYRLATKYIREAVMILAISMPTFIFLAILKMIFNGPLNPHSSSDRELLITTIIFGFVWIISIIQIQTTINALTKEYKTYKERKNGK
ncbi:hypothetical protein [uncultured Helicobacter sp.]|uniref:hypothetical protein n=1 Tax=uncultured Helicobacter sp. TaxID=175537 RepID=UPI00374F4059